MRRRVAVLLLFGAVIAVTLLSTAIRKYSDVL